jgi:outer membrane lipoprotein-sorting protein
MMLHCWTRRSLAAVASCAIVAVSMGTVVLLHAQQPATNAAAETALARMEAAYKTLPALHIKVRWSAKYSGGMSADDFPLPGPDSLELRMERPNKFYLSAASKRDGKQSSYMVVSDGTTLTYWRSATNSFIQKQAPAALSGIAGLLPDTVIGFAIDNNSWEEESIAEWDLLADARTPSITKAAAAQGGVWTMTGPEKLGDAQVNVLRLTPPSGAPFAIEQRYYLDAASHLLRGLATSARGKHPENGRDFTVEMRGVYDLHTTQPTFGDDAFRFVAPRGARPGKGGPAPFLR